MPFEAYYYGTEFRAATEVFHKVVFFIPLGAILAWFVSRTALGLAWLWHRFYLWHWWPGWPWPLNWGASHCLKKTRISWT